MKQIVTHKKLSSLQGLLLVLALVILLVLINYFAIGFLAMYVGNGAANICFWALGCLIAWFVLRVYIVNVVYEMNDDVLRISRKYGKRQRFIEDIYLSRLLFVGSPEETKKRYPEAKRVNAAHAGVKDSITAVAYQSSAGMRIALLQVNAEFKEKLVEAVKRK